MIEFKTMLETHDGKNIVIDFDGDSKFASVIAKGVGSLFFGNRSRLPVPKVDGLGRPSHDRNFLSDP